VMTDKRRDARRQPRVGDKQPSKLCSSNTLLLLDVQIFSRFGLSYCEELDVNKKRPECTICIEYSFRCVQNLDRKKKNCWGKCNKK
jgi:hypothetical protein